MKTRIFLVFFILIVVLNFGVAQSVSQQEAVQVAVKLMQSESRASFSMDSVYRTNTLARNGNTLLYEVLFTNGSSVLLSGHKACTPVLGMRLVEESGASSGLLGRSDSIPDALIELLDGYAEVVNYCYNNQINDGFEKSWDSILQCNIDSVATNYRGVSPFIMTKWGQEESNDGWGKAYNYYVTDSIQYHCSPCPAGCVAVAMAQIMRYWNVPTEIPYRCNQYEWNNMPKELIKKNNSDYCVQRNAIARLIKDCGSSVGMVYCAGGQCGSTASMSATPNALRGFGYHADDYSSKATYSGDWESTLRQCLDEAYPVLYRGNTASSTVGHAFVCCGYKKRFLANGYKYYFNFGWLGEGDGWFVIDNITSNQNIILDYFFHQGAVFNIYPIELCCWQNIIMECDKTFSNGTIKDYSTLGKFKNNNYNYIIGDRAQVHLQAGHEILLTNGFYAAEGSVFTAKIAPCDNSRSEDEISEKLSPELLEEIKQQELEQTGQVSSTSSPTIMEIYPNPVTGTFNIRLGNPSEKVRKVEVFNPQGVLTLSNDNPNENTVDANGLPAGMFLVRVTGNMGNVYFGKFVKE